MPSEKTVAVSFRVTPRFKLLLVAAAARNHRSLTNMLETLLYSYCEQERIEPCPPEDARRKPNSAG